MSGGSTPLIAAIVAVIVAFIGAVITARTSRRATAQQTDVSLSAESRQWVTQAQEDAKEAKSEAADARNEAAAARKEAQAAQVTAHDAEMRLRDVSSLTDGLLRWAERIVRAAHDPAVSDARLREMVNGGPPELSSTRLQRPDRA